MRITYCFPPISALLHLSSAKRDLIYGEHPNFKFERLIMKSFPSFFHEREMGKKNVNFWLLAIKLIYIFIGRIRQRRCWDW